MTRANKSRIRRRRTDDEERTLTTTVTTISMAAARHLLTILLLASLTPWVAGAQQNNNTKNKEVASVISKIYARGCLQEGYIPSSITNLYNGLITNYKCQTDDNFIPTFMISSGSSASIVSKLRIYAPSIVDEDGGGNDYYYPTSYKLEGLHSDGTFHIISEEQITSSTSIMTTSSEQRNNIANSVINSSYEGGDIKLHYTEVSFGTDNNNVEEYVHYRLQFPTTTRTYKNNNDNNVDSDEAQTTATYVVEMGELELVGELIVVDTTGTDFGESDERDTHTDTDPTVSPSYVSFFSFFLWPPKLNFIFPRPYLILLLPYCNLYILNINI